MKVFLMLLVLIHGFLHLLGFINNYGNGSILNLPVDSIFAITTPAGKQLFGILWLVASLCLIYTARLIALNKLSWPRMCLLTVYLSQLLVIIYWRDAKWVSIPNLLIFLIALHAKARMKFLAKFDADVNEMFSNVIIKHGKVLTSEMVSGLPKAVVKWLKNSGVIGREIVHTVRLKQKGFMRSKPGDKNWIPTTAEQYFNIFRPAFFWKVKMNLNSFIPVTGRDEFIDGRGRMQIKLFSLFKIVDQSNNKIAEAALQRWLSEIAWFPSAAICPFIQWSGIDDNTAKATMDWEGTSGSVTFKFDEHGDLKSCTADRYKDAGQNSLPEKWQVDIKEHKVFNGIRIPAVSEVTWKLSTGDFTWFKVQVCDIEYNKPIIYS